MHVLNRDEIEPLDLPGRKMWMMASPKQGNAQKLSMCVIRIQPGETVNPAHCHPETEELVYVLNGEVEFYALNDGKKNIQRLKQGDAVVFQECDVHMTRNVSEKPVELACFFSPASTPDTYRVYENVQYGDDSLKK